MSKRAKIPHPDHIQRMANAVEQQVRSENLLTFLNRRVFFWLGAHGGMRPGERFGLQWKNLDFANNKIRIEHSFNHYDQLKGPKSEAGKRAIGQTREIYAALSDLALYWTIHDQMVADPRFRSYRRKTITTRIQDRWARRHDEPIEIPPRTGFVILSKSRKPMRTNACTWFWRGLLRKAGISDEDAKFITPHSLRHWYASYLLANEVPVPAAAKSLGHSRGSMTLDVYGHVMPDDESTHRAVTKMSETFAPQLLPPPDLPEDKRERKLTEDQVREIRRRIADGEPLQRIGREMGVSLSTVYDIKSGRRWRWLP